MTRKISLNFLFIATSIVMLSLPANGQVYKWVDDEGFTHYSDKKPKDYEVTELEFKTSSYESVTYSGSVVDTKEVAPKARVIMLSASWCGYCRKARQYFNSNGIRFTEYDIEKTAKGKRLYKKLEATGVPVILYGKKRMNGFSESGFRNLYR